MVTWSATAKFIEDNYYRDEFSPFIIYGGPLGIGKSAYALKVLYELYGSWEKVKEYIVFKPEDFVDRCYEMMGRGKREKAIVWDDAGLHVSYLSYNDPFVQAVIEYLNVARTNWASIILTAPTPMMIVKKFRGFPDRYTCKIVKLGSDEKNPQKPRRARVYRNWTAPDLKHSGVHKCWEDDYSALLPDEFYHDWYKPLRDSYAAVAINRMKARLQKVTINKTLNEHADKLSSMMEGTVASVSHS